MSRLYRGVIVIGMTCLGIIMAYILDTLNTRGIIIDEMITGTITITDLMIGTILIFTLVGIILGATQR